MRAVALAALAAALAARVSAAEPADHKNDGHAAPAPSLADQPAPAASEKQALLAELWQRRVLSSELDRWASEDLALLERIRAAERAGALSDLRRVYGGLKGYAVAHKTSSTPAHSPGDLRLTKEGFEKWLFLRSQKALSYFASREIEQKTAFQLTDVDGARLFEPQRGMLTAAGEALYARVERGLSAQWKTPDGVVMGNRRVKPKP